MSLLTEAVNPILESITLGRTDILKTLLEEVKASIKKQDPEADLSAAFLAFVNEPRPPLKHTFLRLAVKVSGKINI